MAQNVSTCHLLRFDKTLTMSFNFLKMEFSNSISINLKRKQSYCFLYNPMSKTSEQHYFKSLTLIKIILLGKLRMALNKNQKVPIFLMYYFSIIEQNTSWVLRIGKRSSLSIHGELIRHKIKQNKSKRHNSEKSI